MAFKAQWICNNVDAFFPFINNNINEKEKQNKKGLLFVLV